MRRKPSSKAVPKAVPVAAVTATTPAATATVTNTSSTTLRPVVEQQYRLQHAPPALTQFTLAPSTRTVVTTTTTTTTTTLPPIVFPPPPPMEDLDPLRYPLAYVNTPEDLREFAFALGGKIVHFNESPDPQQSLCRVSFCCQIPTNSSLTS